MTAITELAAAIMRWLDSAPAPCSRAAVRRAVARRGVDVRSAVTRLLADPSSGIVEVGPRVRGVYRVWTRAAAERIGLHLIERPGAELAELPAAPTTSPPDEATPPPPPSGRTDAPADADDWGNYDSSGYGY